jgi:hypothetical protein
MVSPIQMRLTHTRTHIMSGLHSMPESNGSPGDVTRYKRDETVTRTSHDACHPLCT